MDDYINSAISVFREWKYIFMFFLLIFENIPFIGLITPAITILIVAGFLSASGELNLILLVLVGYSGVVVGDNLFYLLGRFARDKYEWVSSLVKKAPNAVRITGTIPVWKMCFYQFAPYLRMFLPVSLGAIQYQPLKWLKINIVGSLLYVGFYANIGYVIGITLEELDVAKSTATALSIAITIAITAYLVHLYIKRKSYGKKTMD